MNNKLIIDFSDNLYTDYSGINRLFKFYSQASVYYNTTIYLDFYHLTWFDANLSALFGSILSKLSKENNLLFSTDLKFLEDNFEILFRNGFLYSKNKYVDEHKSTVSFRSFTLDDKDGFVKYISEDLMEHQGMPNFDSNQKDKILDSLIEVFCNIQIHSKSKDAFFVCGQYYPKKKTLAFSIVDLGIGFLPAIQIKTNGSIDNHFDAIEWALQKGNTTKVDSPGGLGLSDLYSYFKNSNGNLQIITGDTYWSIDMENTLLKKLNFKTPYVGSMINLFFNCN